ncbi:hypothetical protein OA174_05175 [Actinomycetota bacterium]|nr:hypothetical protein [Actinomycetota bacterium]
MEALSEACGIFKSVRGRAVRGCFPNKAGSRGLFSLEANPWAVVIFVGVLLGLHGLGVDSTKPGTFGALFLGFIPVWLLCGMLWDRVTIGRASRRCATSGRDDRS